jgi:hypothetical protein
MPAATQSAAEVNANLTEMVNAAVRNLLDEQPRSGYGIVHTFAEDFTVPTTAIDDVNDILRLVRMPAGAYIWFGRVTATDMDTNATPTLAFSLLAIDSSDTTKATLVSASTIGQAGGSANLATAALGEFVGDYYLALKTTTAAATAAAGTLSVLIGYSIGVSNVANATLNPRLTDVAL